MNIDKQIEFDKVKEIWADLAITDYAKEKIRDIELCFSENELNKLLKDTTDAKNMIEKVGTPPLQNITEITLSIKVFPLKIENAAPVF